MAHLTIEINHRIAQDSQPAILLVSGGGYIAEFDSVYKAKLKEQGYAYQIDSSSYAALTEEHMQKFNLLILVYPAGEPHAQEGITYASKLPLVMDYIKQGGGVLVFPDSFYPTSNLLLAPLGAEILPENVVDEATLWRQTRYLQEYFCRTTNIIPHAVTQEVKELWYPLTWHPKLSETTLALKVDDNWQVVVKGNKTAYSYRWKTHEEGQNTYSREPPIIAVRQVGKGRVAVFSTRCLHYFHQGYHTIYDGICLEKGDGFRLLSNLYDWLAEPSAKAGIFGGYIEPPSSPEPKRVLPPKEELEAMDIYTRVTTVGGREPVTKIEHKRRNLHNFVGVIGVYTVYSKGFGEVSAYCHKARELGYNFIVFTEDFDQMDSSKWDKLVADCQKESGENFIAIPGIEILDTIGDRYICFDMPAYPKNQWLDATGKRIENHPGFYFGLSHEATAFVAKYLMTPKFNFWSPWYAKFYAGMEVFSYVRGARKISDAWDWYIQCQANDYNLIPIVAHRIWSPNELEQVAGFKTYAMAEKIEGLPACFRYQWYTPRDVYISSGPKILEYAIENGRTAFREEEWRLYIDVESDCDIEEVLIFDRHKVFRRFQPHTKRFCAELISYHDKQRCFVMKVRDAEGGEVITPALYTSDLRQSTYMCTDLQNTLNSMCDLDNAGNLTYFGVMGGYVTGWEGMTPPLLVSNSDVLPESVPGYEYGFQGWQGGASHLIYGQEKQESAVAQREMVFATGDCNMLDNHYLYTLLPLKGGSQAPTEFATSKARFISFTPRTYSQNIMLVEQEINFKQDVVLQDREGPEIGCIQASGSGESFPSYSFINESGLKQKGEREPDKSIEGRLVKGGYVSLFPDFWGSLGIFALDKDYAFLIRDASVQIGYELPQQKVKSGTVLKNRFLVVRGKFGEEDESEFDMIRELYGLDSEPAYEVKLSHGNIKGTAFVLNLRADGYFASGSISPASLPNELPIVVDGLCENWDAGLLDLDTGKLRRVGVFNKAAYLTLDINSKAKRVAIGNLILCNDEEVKLSLLKLNGEYVIEAHNPKATETKISLWIPEWLKVVPRFHQEVLLKSGETVVCYI